jgi:putative ABC transport system permease protein
MPLRKLSIREIQSRPVRSILTLLSIILGVSAIVATLLASSSSRLAQTAMFNSVTGNAALEVESAGGASFDGKPLEAVLDIPGVSIASPLMRRMYQMSVVDDPTSTQATTTEEPATNEPPTKKVSKLFRFQVLGVVPKLDKQVRNYQVVEGRDLDGPSSNDRSTNEQDPSDSSSSDSRSGVSESNAQLPPILMDAGAAKAIRLKLGAKVRFGTAQITPQYAEVVGFTQPMDVSASTQSGVIVADLRTVQRWSKARGKLDVLQIVLKPEANVDKVKSSIEKLLPTGVLVRVPQQRSQLAKETTLAMEQGLGVAIAFSLVIACLVIYNTFQINVGERRRQLGILRSMGTSRKQLLWMIVREGFWLGLIGTTFGCILGYFGASILRTTHAQLLQMDVPSGQGSIAIYLIAFVGGLAISLLGAFFPALRAAKLSPAEAMRVVATGEFGTSRVGWFVAGSLFVTLGFLLQALSMIGKIDVGLVVPGAVSMLIGAVFFLPAILAELSSWVTRFVAVLFKTESKLAQRQLLRHRGRTSLTIGIVFMAVSLELGMSGVIMDHSRNVEGWHKRAIVGDFFVRAAMPDMNTGKAAEMPEGLIEKVRAMPGVTIVDSLDFVQSRIGETTVMIVVRNFSSQTQDYFDLIEGDGPQVLQGVREGQVVLGSVLAEREKLKMGDSIDLDTLEGTTKLTIAGVTNEYIAGGLTLYMESEQAKRLFNVEGADVIVVYATPELKGNVEKQLIAMSDENGLIFQSHADLITIVRTKLNGAVGGLWAVLAMGTLIAAFGLINTLAMNIIEQTREIGMLRVVAMTRQQIRNMVLAQAMIMGIIGILPGIFAGIWIAYVINLTTRPITGHAVEFQIYPWMIAGTVIVEMLVILIAAMIPAERAARLNLSSALQYE